MDTSKDNQETCLNLNNSDFNDDFIGDYFDLSSEDMINFYADVSAEIDCELAMLKIDESFT